MEKNIIFYHIIDDIDIINGLDNFAFANIKTLFKFVKKNLKNKKIIFEDGALINNANYELKLILKPIEFYLDNENAEIIIKYNYIAKIQKYDSKKSKNIILHGYKNKNISISFNLKIDEELKNIDIDEYSIELDDYFINNQNNPNIEPKNFIIAKIPICNYKLKLI